MLLILFITCHHEGLLVAGVLIYKADILLLRYGSLNFYFISFLRSRVALLNMFFVYISFFYLSILLSSYILLYPSIHLSIYISIRPPIINLIHYVSFFFYLKIEWQQVYHHKKTLPLLHLSWYQIFNRSIVLPIFFIYFHLYPTSSQNPSYYYTFDN